MKGIIALYLNLHPEHEHCIEDIMNLVQKINAPLLDKVQKESDYVFMPVPTTKEACRVEKIDFDAPFPRFVPKKRSQ